VSVVLKKLGGRITDPEQLFDVISLDVTVVPENCIVLSGQNVEW